MIKYICKIYWQWYIYIIILDFNFVKAFQSKKYWFPIKKEGNIMNDKEKELLECTERLKKFEQKNFDRVYPIQMDTIGIRIKAIRKNAKKSQKQFAEEFGISQSHISNIEKGSDKPSLTLIKFICLKYYVDEKWLMCNVGTMYVYETFSVLDETIKNKYVNFKHEADILIEEKSGEILLKCIDSFTFFYGLLRAYKLKGEDVDNFILHIYDMADTLEHLQFLTSQLNNMSKKISYQTLFEYQLSAEKLLKEINKSIREAMNIYLKNYDLPCDFKL